MENKNKGQRSSSTANDKANSNRMLLEESPNNKETNTHKQQNEHHKNDKNFIHHSVSPEKVSAKYSEIEINRKKLHHNSQNINIHMLPPKSASNKVENTNHENLITSTNKEKEQATMKIKQLFEFYCQFGERMNTKFMKSHKFHIFATDAEILDDKFTKTRLELIFTAENKHKPQMDFNTFLNTLIKVAEYKYKSKSNDPSVCLKILLSKYVFPLYDRVYKNMNVSNLNDVSNIKNTVEDTKTNILTTTQNVQCLRKSLIVIPELNSNNEVDELIFITSPILYEVFKVYFPHELSMSENETFLAESSFKAFKLFNKDFDLCPTLVNKTVTFKIWQTETTDENEESDERFLLLMKNVDLKKNNNNNFFGRYFTFFKYLRSIIKISEVSFERMEYNINRKLNSFGNI